ncbi:MAG: phosphate ABC transporter ATP-binding protein [Candidatus Lokiarchaeota archaeon]|nr:phosphate ABC transporter ATP-binding protein [Candidatus Lokiarchaeota archaeon]
MNIKVSIRNNKKENYSDLDSARNLNENNNIIECKDLNLWYDDNHALKNINLKIKKNKVTAIIGPSGCGKSTLIRSFNRMNDVIENCKINGEIRFHGKNIYASNNNVMQYRKRIGMIFQKPNPFPMSVFDNVAYGPRIHKVNDTNKLEEIVETSLKRAVLWDEVCNRLKDSAMGLSGGQQQRLCIARALAVEPEVILMDEPTSSLDPISSGKIEDLINQLKQKYTVIIVTHNMQQAARISDYTCFMYIGELIEFGETNQIFERPKKKLTENYITGRFG